MRSSIVILLFILIAFPFSDISEAGNSKNAGPYSHFYCQGHFTPGSYIKGRIAGGAGTNPVALLLSGSMLSTPINTTWGYFYLNSYLLFGPLGTIPTGGVMELPCNIPMTPAPYNLYIQAIIGNKLSNLFVMEVRDIAPTGMVMIPGGGYAMGDHHDNALDAMPVHYVEVDSFLMDIHEVTNRQYCEYLNAAYHSGLISIYGGKVYQKHESECYCSTTADSPYSRITWDGGSFGIVKGKAHHPMVTVSWYGAVAYANWRSVQDGLTPCYDFNNWSCAFGVGGYRLPTEAEWEYAARGGEHSPYYRFPWGDTINGSKANYWGSGDAYENGAPPCTTPVEYYCNTQIPSGADMANGYGLYDMAGNVFEWCNDWYYANYYKYCLTNGIYDNPTGPVVGNNRVVRGGGWVMDSANQVTARRIYYAPDFTPYSFGFRLVKD